MCFHTLKNITQIPTARKMEHKNSSRRKYNTAIQHIIIFSVLFLINNRQRTQKPHGQGKFHTTQKIQQTKQNIH